MKRILVAIDASYGCEEVMRQALELAENFHARLYAVSVIQHTEYTTIMGDMIELREQWENVFREELDKCRSKADEREIACEERILYGHPAQRIVQFVKDNNIDLVVMGAKGSSSLDEFLLGSVAQKVSSYAPCSVLIIK